MTYHGYAFWIQRPQDTKAWPAIFEDEARARSYPHRVTPVELVRTEDLATLSDATVNRGGEHG